MKGVILSAKQRRLLRRIIISAASFAATLLLERLLPAAVGLKNGIFIIPLLCFFAIYLFIGHDVIAKAVKNVVRLNPPDENLLMTVASLGAFALAVYNAVALSQAEGASEGVAVMLLYQTGELFQKIATERSRASIAELMQMRPDYARVVCNGAETVVSPEEVAVGESITVYPGERIALDGVITAGSTALDCRALTGEVMPIEKNTGEEVLSGSVNLSSRITLLVTKPFEQSTVSKILELVENASDKKSRAEGRVAQFARYYTPTVLILAALVALLPSILTGDWAIWIYRSLSFLVVSCPCALVISVPMTFFIAMGFASRHGVLFKGSECLEQLGKSNCFLFDKTGTLTTGELVIDEIYPKDKTREILALAAVAESASTHPIAKAILSKVHQQHDTSGFELTTLAGFGVVAKSTNREIICASPRLFAERNIALPERTPQSNTVVCVAENCKFVGYITLKDKVKTGVNEVIGALNAQGCTTVMLTGDNQAAAKTVASEAGVLQYKFDLLPQDKVSVTEDFINDARNKCVCFVGDGINDAPVLMRADIGVAMGSIGSDSAVEASDVVLMKDDLSHLLLARKIAKKCTRKVMQNVLLSIGVKLAIMILSTLGITNMWLAVFGDVGVAMLAILNAFTVALGYGKNARFY